MNKNQRGIVHLFLLVVVFVAVVGIGYFAYKNGQLRKSTPVEEEETNTSETTTYTSDWKTYRNDEYNWIIKYPSNWYVYDKGFRYLDENGQEKWSNPVGSVFFRSKPFPSYIAEGTEFNVNGLVVQFYPVKVQLNDRIAELKELSTDLVTISETQIDGKHTVKTIHDSNLSNLSLRNNLSTTYWIDYPTNGFLVLTISHPNTDSKGGHNEIYDQILSTFEFIEN